MEAIYIYFAGTTTKSSSKTETSSCWTDHVVILGLLLAEALLGYLIIERVAYTEIDWEAYMQEVKMWLVDGIYDYRQIYGGTGPLVYPAGFLYLFALLRYLTHQGEDIHLGQYMFLVMYLVTQGLILLIYTKGLRSLLYNAKTTSPLQKAHVVWGWRIAMGLCCCSKRLHSIFLLRLFNEGPTMLFLYASILCFCEHWWYIGCVLFSLAVSIKMNVLLFAPGLLLLLLQQSQGNLWKQVILQRLGLGCALPQLILGAPFLFTFPESYLRKAFELDRVFFFKWTVNWKFLPEELFVSKAWAVLLLTCHIGSLIYFAYLWIKASNQEYNKSTRTKKALSSLHYIHHVHIQSLWHVLCEDIALSVLCLVLLFHSVCIMVQQCNHVETFSMASHLSRGTARCYGVILPNLSSYSIKFSDSSNGTPGNSYSNSTSNQHLATRD